LELYFGSVHASLYTTFAAMAGGYQWAEIVMFMEQMGWVYQTMFVTFMALFTFCMMNIITGIFVDNALRADEELLSDRKFQEEQDHCASLTTVFEQNLKSTNHAGMITLPDFVEMADHPELTWFLRELRIPVREAGTLFHLLDTNETRALEIHECVHGLLRLKGQSTALDMRTLMHEIADMNHLLKDYTTFAKRIFSSLLPENGTAGPQAHIGLNSAYKVADVNDGNTVDGGLKSAQTAEPKTKVKLKAKITKKGPPTAGAGASRTGEF